MFALIALLLPATHGFDPGEQVYLIAYPKLRHMIAFPIALDPARPISS